MIKHLKLRITGRVQGVGFRFHTRRKALFLGLKGFVENRPDGSVYAEIEGPSDLVDEMLQWCRTGSPMAQVENVAVQEAPPVQYEDFEVRR